MNSNTFVIHAIYLIIITLILFFVAIKLDIYHKEQMKANQEIKKDLSAIIGELNNWIAE